MTPTDAGLLTGPTLLLLLAGLELLRLGCRPYYGHQTNNITNNH